MGHVPAGRFPLLGHFPAPFLRVELPLWGISQLVGFSLLGHFHFLRADLPQLDDFPFEAIFQLFCAGPLWGISQLVRGRARGFIPKARGRGWGRGRGPGGGVGEGARRIRGAGAGEASEKRGRGQSSEGSRRGPIQETGHAPPAFPLLGPPCRKAPPAAVAGR